MKFKFLNLEIRGNLENLETWKAVFSNVRFRSWSSKPLSVNAALVEHGADISYLPACY